MLYLSTFLTASYVITGVAAADIAKDDTSLLGPQTRFGCVLRPNVLGK